MEKIVFNANVNADLVSGCHNQSHSCGGGRATLN